MDFHTGVGSLSDLSALRPIVAGVELSGYFVVNQRSFFRFDWSRADDAGRYILFLAAVVPGGFSDGTLDAGDIIAIGTAPFLLLREQNIDTRRAAGV